MDNPATGGPKHSVLHVIGSTVGGGAERFVVDLAAEFSSRGHDIAIFALSARTDNAGRELRERLSREGIRFTHGPTVKVRIGAVLSLRRELETFAPQIVHLHTPNTELAHALASIGSGALCHKLIRTIHSTEVLDSALYRWAYRKNSAAISVGCSDSAAESHAAWLGQSVRKIENGVQFHWPIQSDELREQSRRLLELPLRKRIFLAVGRMYGDCLQDAPKGFDVLIKAWRQSSAVREDGSLYILGDGQLRPALEALAAGDESIHLCGVQSNVENWFLAADVFVMSSRSEGLPIAAIEACGTGLPCLFSDIPPLRELVAPAVLWSKVDSVDQLSANLERALTELPAVNAADVARSRATYGIETVADRYAGQYAEL